MIRGGMVGAEAIRAIRSPTEEMEICFRSLYLSIFFSIFWITYLSISHLTRELKPFF